MPMQAQQQALYQRLLGYAFDDPSHEIGFTDHLMRANGWSRTFASRAVQEYRKFVFLALVAEHQVTPSDQVDQVWHLHLLFSEAYWNDFCPRVLGRPLHHHPARGGAQERVRFLELYQATIASYRHFFGTPPVDLWPPADIRFGRDLQMQRAPVRRRWRWLPRRQRALAGAAPAAAGLLAVVLTAGAALAREMAASPSVEASGAFPEVPFFVLFGMASLTLWALSRGWLIPLMRSPMSLPSLPSLDPEELAYLDRGAAGVVELGLASLVDQGVLRAEPYSRSIQLLAMPQRPLTRAEQVVLNAHRRLSLDHYPEHPRDAVPFSKLIHQSQCPELVRSLHHSLQAQRLILQPLPAMVKEVSSTIMSILLCVAIFFRPQFGKPLLVQVFACSLLFAFSPLIACLPRTTWGDTVLEHHRERADPYNRLLRVALVGPEAFVGGSLDQLGELIRLEEADRAASSCAGCGG